MIPTRIASVPMTPVSMRRSADAGSALSPRRRRGRVEQRLDARRVLELVEPDDVGVEAGSAWSSLSRCRSNSVGWSPSQPRHSRLALPPQTLSAGCRRRCRPGSRPGQEEVERVHRRGAERAADVFRAAGRGLTAV
jgi:hypothetical protein